MKRLRFYSSLGGTPFVSSVLLLPGGYKIRVTPDACFPPTKYVVSLFLCVDDGFCRPCAVEASLED